MPPGSSCGCNTTFFVFLLFNSSERSLRIPSRSHSATKQNIIQSAKVGYRPSCAKATHVALPASYALGEHSDMEAEGFTVLEQFGPRAPRRLAALHYAESSGSLFSIWDRTAASLIMQVPDSLLRSAMHGEGLNLHAPTSKPPPSTSLCGPKNWNCHMMWRYPDAHPAFDGYGQV